MLDDLKFIHQRDSQDALGIAEKQWQQLEQAYEIPEIGSDFDNIVYAGMGGSALAALISRSWPNWSLPFEVIRRYHAPSYVSTNTLFIACSYSGNTEETLSALAEAENKGAKIITIAGGGKLADRAREKGHILLTLPEAAQPRYAVLYNLKAILEVMKAANLSDAKDIEEQVNSTKEFLKNSIGAWLPTVPKDRNPAKKLAYELAGKSVAVYGGPLMAPVAYKWKISFNENAKNVAWWNELSEFDHNELTGWAAQPTQKPYGIIELRSNLEHPRIQRRYEVAERLLSGRRPAPNVINVQGQTLAQQLVWAMAFGDFVTIYLALLNNVDPAPVELVERFKKELG